MVRTQVATVRVSAPDAAKLREELHASGDSCSGLRAELEHEFDTGDPADRDDAFHNLVMEVGAVAKGEEYDVDMSEFADVESEEDA